MNSLLAIYLPTRREWAMSRDLVTLMYAAIECDNYEGEYRILFVTDTGYTHPAGNRFNTAHWLGSRKIEGTNSGRLLEVKDNRVTAYNLKYKIDGRHLIMEK